MRIDLSPSALRRKILDMPTERAIALGRFALALTCVAAVWISPPSQSGARQSLWLILAFYVVFAGALILAPRLPLKRLGALLEQGIDITATGFLIFFTDGSASAFFSLFMFNLIVSLLRWNWRGALATAAITASSLLLLPARFTMTDDGLVLLDADLSRVIALGGLLIICGAMLAYLGAHRERSRRRFEQLASWPMMRQLADTSESPAESLGHVAMMLQAPRILLVWEEPEEPVRQICLWDGGRIEREQVGPDVFGALVRPGTPNVTFWTERDDQGALDPGLRERYGITRVLTAGFERPRCSGRIFVLDRWTWSEEDSAVVELITERVGIDLEERIARRQLDSALVSQERMRLGRDLHDGLLQDLAAANIQLKLISDGVPAEFRERLANVRGILTGETVRVRDFVEESRFPTTVSASIPVLGQLRRRVAVLVTQWNCAIDVTVEPPGMTLPVFTVSQLEHVLSEATSNAVRHGGASRVSLDLACRGKGIALRICDNGCGFKAADGPFRAGQPITVPLSLRSRIEELGGRLRVSNIADGAELTIDVPL